MRSIARELQRQIEDRGDLVKIANLPDWWFAVEEKKWRRLVTIARRDGRDGPNIVVCKTNSDQARDHFVIPYSVLQDFLVEHTLTTLKRGGSQRWNLTIKDGKLHVSHRQERADINKYYGTPLPGEEADTSKPLKSSVDISNDKGVTPIVPAGAGFGDSERNREVESKAVERVTMHYGCEGWEVITVESERCGYDLRCRRGEEELHVEVKGVGGTEEKFVITANELKTAEQDARFILALVTGALSEKPRLRLFPQREFRQVFSFEPIDYWAIRRGSRGGG